MSKLKPIVLRTTADVIKLRRTWIAVMETDRYIYRCRPVIAFKWCREDGTSYFNPGEEPKFHHKLGAQLIVLEPDYNPTYTCGAGVNVASAAWVARSTRRIVHAGMVENISAAWWQVEFSLKDIVAIPFGTDGKLRVRAATITKALTRRKLLAIRNGK